ncbi:MAG: 50S ribosomal protein L24 [Candidatus Kerfeldbacteria bacterium]
MTTQQSKIRIKSGDTVKVLKGKDSGKTGTVSQVLPSMNKVVVDGVNQLVKHLKSGKKDEKGQRIEFFGPIPAANVALVCPKCNKPTRIGYAITKGEDGKEQKSRACKKCNESFS